MTNMASSEAPWVELIEERTPHLMKEVAPTKLLPYLNLSNCDKENIRCDETNKGKTEATVALLEKLKKQNGPNGRKAFDELVRALRKVGSQQSALLLDPHFKGKNLHYEFFNGVGIETSRPDHFRYIYVRRREFTCSFIKLD